MKHSVSRPGWLVALMLLVLVASACVAPAANQPTGSVAPTTAPAAAPATTEAGQPTTAPAAAAPASGGTILFHSSQFSPVTEAEKMRNVVLKDFKGGTVDFSPQDTAPFADIPLAQAKAGKMNISLIGGLHGDFPPFIAAGIMSDVSDVMTRLADRNFPQQYVDLGKEGTDQQMFVPWMQATYIMAINKQALQYLPQGADVNALTYEQLTQWGAAIQKATGQRMIGFPAGPKGLIHRFWQGYLYPSYTGTAVTGFKSPEAVKMWQDFKDLWQYVNPASVNYDFMQEPLRSGEVWIAWDHVARLPTVLNDKPNDFITAPAPAGPKGRGFMPVLAGLGIPKDAPNRAGAEALIDYLTQPATQITVLRELAFFPVVEVQLPEDLPAGIRLEADAVQKTTSAKDAIPSLIPVGLGTKGGEWNKAYNDTFNRIVLKNEDITTVLQEQAQILQQILDETKAPCWAPDPPSQGTCQVK